MTGLNPELRWLMLFKKKGNIYMGLFSKLFKKKNGSEYCHGQYDIWESRVSKFVGLKGLYGCHIIAKPLHCIKWISCKVAWWEENRWVFWRASKQPIVRCFLQKQWSFTLCCRRRIIKIHIKGSMIKDCCTTAFFFCRRAAVFQIILLV